MKSVLAGCALGLLCAVLPVGATEQPSFSCERASTVAERMICTHATLSRADRELAGLYASARAQRDGEAARLALRDEQRQWLKQRDSDCLGGRSLAQATADLASFTCLQAAYDRRIRHLRDLVSSPIMPTSVRTMPDAALDSATTPASSRRFDRGVFSDDGQALAVLVGDDDNEAVRQVWLYARAEGLVVPATPSLGPGNPNSEAVAGDDVDMVWDGDTIYVRAESEGDDGAGASHTYAATLRQSPSRLATVSGRVQRLFDRNPRRYAADADLPGDDDGLIHDAVYALGGTLVWLSDQARGRVVVRMRAGGVGMPTQDIVHGSWELTHLQFDQERLFLPSPDGLLVFDLATRKFRRIAGTAEGDRPVAWSPASRLLAWSSARPCPDATASASPSATRRWLCVATVSAL